MPLLRLSEQTIYDTSSGFFYYFDGIGQVQINFPGKDTPSFSDGEEAKTMWAQLLAMCSTKEKRTPEQEEREIDALLYDIDKVARDYESTCIIPLWDAAQKELMRRAVRHFLAKQAQ